jgi:hypothetical protein
MGAKPSRTRRLSRPGPCRRSCWCIDRDVVRQPWPRQRFAGSAARPRRMPRRETPRVVAESNVHQQCTIADLEPVAGGTARRAGSRVRIRGSSASALTGTRSSRRSRVRPAGAVSAGSHDAVGLGHFSGSRSRGTPTRLRRCVGPWLRRAGMARRCHHARQAGSARRARSADQGCTPVSPSTQATSRPASGPSASSATRNLALDVEGGRRGRRARGSAA